jgi:ketosteroid isomerase-like protein
MKNIKYMFLISILSLSSAFAASSPAASLEEMSAIWVSSFDNGNTESLKSLYTENAMAFPPSSEILQGPTAISAYLESLKKVGFGEYSISNVDTQIKGDTAYTTALWETTRIDANGNEIILDGNITNVLERQVDGSWKIKLQSWN